MVDILYIIAGFILFLSFGSTQYTVKEIRKELNELKEQLSSKSIISLAQKESQIDNSIIKKYQWGRVDMDKDEKNT